MLGLRPFDVQLIGAMILHNGEIAEMRTGEGKTLVAVLPAYLNALSGKGVQVELWPSNLTHACCPNLPSSTGHEHTSCGVAQTAARFMILWVPGALAGYLLY